MEEKPASVLQPGTHLFVCLANINSGPNMYAPPWAPRALKEPSAVQGSQGTGKQL